MKYTKVIMAIAACIVLGLTIYYLSDGERGAQTPELTPETPAASVTETEKNQDADDMPEEQPDQNEVVTGIGSKTNTDKLYEVMLSAEEFYRDSITSTPMITQDGFLYNAAADITITTDYLIKREYLSRSYSVEGAAILYLSPKDVTEIAPEHDNMDEDLKVYVAAPTATGYSFATRPNERFEMSNEDFGNLLLKYSTNHGEVRRITGSTEEYRGINSAIKEHRDMSSDFYIRHGMRDDKYAVVIASPKDNYNIVYQYAFMMENNTWKIIIPYLESVSMAKSVINNVYYDLSVSLSPDYDLNYHLGYMQKDFSGISETLVRDGYLTEDSTEIKFISATNMFLFAKYANGQMFVGVMSDGNMWILGEVDSEENALNHFKTYDSKAPDFVIIWE